MSEKRPRRIHFFPVVSVALLLLGATASFVVMKLGSYTPADKEEYEALIGGVSPEQEGRQISYQQRQKVQKDFFFHRDGVQHHLALKSNSAQLALQKENGEVEVVEKMNGVSCDLQEELILLLPNGKEAVLQSDGSYKLNGDLLSADYPDAIKAQRILHLEAADASYFYQSEKLLGEQVQVRRYIAPGHSLDEHLKELQLISRGTADQIELTHNREGFRFKANGMKAALLEPSNQSGKETVVQGRDVEYDGNKISLKGEAQVENPLGIASADLMTLMTHQEGGEISTAELCDHVVITFDQGGTLSCSKAILDHQALVGHFFSGDTPIFYEIDFGNQNHLKIQAEKMDASMTKSPLNAINNITAEGNVKITHNGNLTAKGDRITYLNLATTPPSASGLLMLSPADASSFCSIEDQRGVSILCREVTYDSVQNTMTLDQPKGTFRFEGAGEPMQFSSDTMLWNRTSDTLTLKGAVSIHHDHMGSFETPHELIVAFKEVNGKSQISTLESSSETTLVYHDATKGASHSLKCKGPCVVNHDQLEVRLSSPIGEDELVQEEMQLALQDQKGDIFADKALIKYEIDDENWVPNKIVLRGNVRIYHRLPVAYNDLHKIQQYVLADRVDFWPKTHEMLFKAAPAKRVLLFDSQNELEVSAPSLKIVRDVATKKESIQGMGDVRFHLNDLEIEELKKKFSLDRLSPKEKKE